jgi:hypothetical protein
VTKLAPAKGSVAGGTKVKITGLNFENPTVTTVSFGKEPAQGRAGQVLALQPSARHATKETGEAALADRARLPRAQGRARP